MNRSPLRLILCMKLLSSVLLLIPAATAAETSGSPSIAFRPGAGRTYDYGIEYLIVEKTNQRQKPLLIRQRCRLRIVVDQSDRAEWNGTFQTIPFLGTHLARSKESLSEVEERIKKSIDFDPPPIPNLPPSAQALRERSNLARKESARRDLLQRERYPGLFRFCEGTVVSSSDGKMRVGGDVASLPFATGDIARLIFLQLPEDGDCADGFSSREVNPLFVKSATDGESKESKMSVLSMLTPREATTKQHLAFDRDLEILGGASVGTNLALTGKGTWEFSPSLGMPYSGSLDCQIKGTSFVGYGSQFEMRVGFHHLDPVRAMLFDANLLPKLDALDPVNLQRIDTKTQTAMRKAWDGSPTGGKSKSALRRAQSEAAQLALRTAPPPFESALQKTVEEALAQEGRQPILLDQVMQRWTQLRSVARRVPRKWSDQSDTFSIDAFLHSLDDNTLKIVRVDNNQIVSVPLDSLSKTDIEFAKTYGQPAPANAR